MRKKDRLLPIMAANRFVGVSSEEVYFPEGDTSAKRFNRFSREVRAWSNHMRPLSMPFKPIIGNENQYLVGAYIICA